MLKPISNLILEKDNLYIDSDKLILLRNELEDFLDGEKELNTPSVAKRIMLSQEIKTNNTIEGYREDISFIEEVKEKKKINKDSDSENRIINLYNGYNYIFGENDINKDNLKYLYDILSKNLLSLEELDTMGPYYREEDVYIFSSDRLDRLPEKGIDPSLLEDRMDRLFAYLNDDKNIDSMTDYYIKSQIAHFYFVDLHPYYDINGRTARTLSMWYLLNNLSYPYIIFNRAIHDTKNSYYQNIAKCKNTNNITSFIEYLMVETKKELEKEYIIQAIKASTNERLSALDFYTILNILSMKSIKTVKDFATFYNRKNEKRRVSEVHDGMIAPLIEKKILIKGRDTLGKYDNDQSNFFFEINKEKLDLDKSKIRRISF